jgi:hypothetical protein
LRSVLSREPGDGSTLASRLPEADHIQEIDDGGVVGIAAENNFGANLDPIAQMGR